MNAPWLSSWHVSESETASASAWHGCNSECKCYVTATIEQLSPCWHGCNSECKCYVTATIEQLSPCSPRPRINQKKSMHRRCSQSLCSQSLSGNGRRIKFWTKAHVHHGTY